MHIFKHSLRRYSGFYSCISFALIAYFQIWLWVAFPVDTGLQLLWSPDNSLQIVSVADNSVASGIFQAGDFIRAVDGRALHQTGTVFNPPIRPTYQLTIERDGVIQELSLVLASTQPMTFATVTAIGFIGWAAGAILLLYRRRDEHNALSVGYAFLFIGTLFILIQGAILGVPGMWVSHGLSHYAGAVFILLGLLPRQSAFSRPVKRRLKTLFTISSTFAILGWFEAGFLYRRGISYMHWTGFSLVRLSYLTLALGLLGMFALLFWRRWRTTQPYLKRQLSILLFFVALGTFPPAGLTLLPQLIAQRILLPSSIGFSLLLFIPLGYLFVIFRQGYLQLDLFVRRFLIGTVLALITFVIYGAIWERLNALVWEMDEDTSAILTLLTLTLILLIYRPIKHAIQQLFYGRQLLNPHFLNQLTTDLASQPTLPTLESFIGDVSHALNIEQTTLVLNLSEHDWVNGHETAIIQIDDAFPSEQITRWALKADWDESLANSYPWATLLIPITLAGKTVGIWLFSPPKLDGHFNLAILHQLQQLADIVSVGLQAIQLFEYTNQATNSIMFSHALQLRHVASEIHDRPLASLIDANTLLQQFVAAEQGDSKQETLSYIYGQVKHAIGDLRVVCENLRPDTFDQGLDTLVNDVIDSAPWHTPTIIPANNFREIATLHASENVKMALYHILTESLNNAARHANASEVHVSVTHHQNYLLVNVEDNGNGGSTLVQSLGSLIQRRNHQGLFMMHHWAQIARGTLSITENTQGGVAIHAKLNLHSRT